MGLFKKEIKTEPNVEVLMPVRGDVGEFAWQFKTAGGEVFFLRFKDKNLWKSITTGEKGTLTYQGNICVGWQKD